MPIYAFEYLLEMELSTGIYILIIFLRDLHKYAFFGRKGYTHRGCFIT